MREGEGKGEEEEEEGGGGGGDSSRAVSEMLKTTVQRNTCRL